MNEEGTSLVAQWLRLLAVGGEGLIPGWGTRPSMPQLRVCMPGFPDSSVGKESICNAVRFLGWEDLLGKG